MDSEYAQSVQEKMHKLDQKSKTLFQEMVIVGNKNAAME